MVYGYCPADKCWCDNKKPCVFIFPEDTDNKSKEKREHSDTLVPTENTWFEKHNVTQIHTAKKSYYRLDEGKV